jgi:hypothetical protein
MANEYASLAEVKATMNLDGESFADADLQRAITAASRGLDTLAHRRFYKDTDDTSVRYYTADECSKLRIDDVIDVAEIATDADGNGTFGDLWTANTDYVLEPLNAPADGWPWTTVRAHRLGSFSFPTCYPRAVRVTGQFGWENVPDGIKEATVILSSKLMLRTREAPFGVVSYGMEGAAAHIARTDPDVMFLAGPYIRHRVSVA